MVVVNNQRTRGAVRLILTRMLEGSKAFLGTATSGSTTTAVDSANANVYPDDYWNNSELTNQTQAFTKYVTDFTGSTCTFTIPTSASTTAADVLEVHKRDAWLKAQYDDAIDMAVQGAGHAHALYDKVDESMAFQRGRSLYPIPSGFTFIYRLSADDRSSFLARHPSHQWDTLQQVKGAAGNNYVAQSFKIKGGKNPAFVLGDVYLLLGKTGSPSGNLTLTVETNSSSAPVGVAGSVATSATVAASSVNAEPTYVRFTFTTRPVLTSDTTYWLSLTGSYSASTTACVTWANDSTDSGYSDGSPVIGTSAPSWTALTGDLVFMVRDNQRYERANLTPNKHFRVVRDTTKYLELTPAGVELLNYSDGSALRLEGQGVPALPSADTSTLEVPYDYVVARAGMLLLPQNFRFNPDAATLMRMWAAQVDDLEQKMASRAHPGSLIVEAL